MYLYNNYIMSLLHIMFPEELDESVDGGEGVVMDPNGPTLRNADHVIATAFDKKWLGSIPRSKIEALRKEFRVSGVYLMFICQNTHNDSCIFVMMCIKLQKASEKAQLLRQTSG